MLPLLLAALLCQEDLDARLEALGARLAKDPASAMLAELCAGETGRAAIRERVDALVGRRARLLDHDPVGRFEEHLFREDGTGALHLRPERQAEFERLAAEVASAHTRMASFNRRAFELAGRITGEGELEKKARGWWSDSTFRVGFFMARAEDLQERDLAGLLDEFLGRGLVAVDGGKRRVGGSYKTQTLEAAQGVRDRLARIQELEKAYLKHLAGLSDETRLALVTETATAFVVGRLLRQSEEELPGAIGQVAEGQDGEGALVFHVPLAELAGPLKEALQTLGEFKAWFESTASAMAGEGPDEDALVELLRSPPARVLIVERLLGRRQEQIARADAVFAEVVADGFEGEGQALRVKKGRYVGEDNKDSAEALDAEHKSVVDGFLADRRGFDVIAELCADPKAAWTFSSHPGTLLVREHLERVTAEARRAIEDRGFEFFSAFYLETKGDVVSVRPVHALRIQDLARRAAQILKERAGQ